MTSAAAAVRRDRGVRAGWLLMTVLALGVAGYASLAIWSPDTIDFIAAREGRLRQVLILHAVTGLAALTIGPFQLAASIRNRWPRLHRISGRVYLGSIAVSGTTGFWLAFYTVGGLPATAGFATLAVLWLVSGALAWRAILGRDFRAHRAWMMRAYALTFAAVTLRIYLGLGALAGYPFAEVYAAAAWASWVFNLLFVEWLLAREAPGAAAGRVRAR